MNVSVGETFYLTAPNTLTGSYTSPEMKGEIEGFQSYVITASKKQDQVFGIVTSQSVSFKVNWTKFGRVELIKKSSDENITADSEYYSLKGARYVLYSKAGKKSYGEFITDKTEAPHWTIFLMGSITSKKRRLLRDMKLT